MIGVDKLRRGLLSKTPLWLSIVVCAGTATVWLVVHLLTFGATGMTWTCALPLLICLAIMNIGAAAGAVHLILRARESAAARALQEANAAKDQFLAVLSHELRTPLNPALMIATVLEQDPQLSPRLREDVSVIRRNIELEARLIDDMLDLTRIARGNLVLNRRTIDGREILRHAVAICHSEATDKRLELCVSLCAEPVYVDADAARLQQVFWSLLMNAIKFTPEGGRISVTAETGNPTGNPGTAGVPWPDGSRVFRVRVADNGAGIEAGALPRIFQAFEQAGHEISRRFGGMGMGLAICRGVLKHHGGSIEAASAGPGLGATFTVELPVVELQAQRLPDPGGQLPVTRTTGNCQLATGNSSGLRILLVEDHETTARITARLLRGFGHEVRTAGSVQAALGAFGQGDFDLVISDLGLPDGTGCDLMRQLLARRCEDRAGKALKAIALSGYGAETDIRNSIDAGFLEHLTKPINTRQLELAIQRVADYGRALE